VHLLIGRRHTDTSTLYWGWPHDATLWSQWLSKPFDAALLPIAQIIDTLTIAYDLRNPLGQDRLQIIESLQENHITNGRPQIAEDKTKIPLAQQYPFKLANGTAALPPTGTYAQDVFHEYDDSDSDDENTPLHNLSRHAAFKRVAVGWQRI
jgi:hypothetical protein